MRLSKHFLLLDFLYDQSTIDCAAYCGDLLSDKITSIKEDSEEFLEGRYLCETILERIVEKHGPISIAAGLWFRDLPKQGKAHDTGLAPHEWKHDTGAAADVVVHSWVNEKKRPASFLKTLPSSNVEYNRVNDYPGSEFCCLASRSQGNCFKRGVERWDKLNERANKEILRACGRNSNWRREPYTLCHARPNAESDLGYKDQLKDVESLWCDNLSLKSESNIVRSVIYGRKHPKDMSLLDHSIAQVPDRTFEDYPGWRTPSACRSALACEGFKIFRSS